jgi:hypothetical protein
MKAKTTPPVDNALISISVSPNALTLVDEVKEINELLEIAAQMPAIASEEQNAQVNELMARATELEKIVEARRKTMKTPVDRLVKLIQDEAAKVQGPAKQIQTMCKRQQAIWVMECQRKLAEAEARRKKLEEQAAAEQTDDRPTAPLIVPEEVLPMPDVTTRWHEDVEITDEKLIPRKYWKIDMDLLRADVVNGGYVVPGAKKTRVPKVINGSFRRAALP